MKNFHQLQAHRIYQLVLICLEEARGVPLLTKCFWKRHFVVVNLPVRKMSNRKRHPWFYLLLKVP